MHQPIQSFNLPLDILTFEDWLVQIPPPPPMGCLWGKKLKLQINRLIITLRILYKKLKLAFVPTDLRAQAQSMQTINQIREKGKMRKIRS